MWCEMDKLWKPRLELLLVTTTDQTLIECT